MAALQLAQQGKLGLREPIGHYIPDYADKKAAASVTAHHLVTHASDVSSDPMFFMRKIAELHLHAIDDQMRFFGGVGLEFEPGTKRAYSNYGFQLLGLLVQWVAEQDYREYARSTSSSRPGSSVTSSPTRREMPSAT